MTTETTLLRRTGAVSLIGTFHKTGTVLWLNILNRAKQAKTIRLWNMDQKAGHLPRHWDIAFNRDAARLDPLIAEHGDRVRCVICVRDPRDVVVSSAYYHMKAKEPWLHKPLKAFGGLTYQQAINAEPDMQARFLFEMRNSAARTLGAMRNIPVSDPRVRLTKLETLARDEQLAEFGSLFAFLGLREGAQRALTDIAREEAVFSASKRSADHIRNPNPAQYRREFSVATMDAYNAKYAGIAERLGYAA